MASALKKLLRAKPTTVDIARATKEIETESARSAAVLGSALLEDVMRLVILTRMPDLGEPEQDVLFFGSGPLSTFSARIQVAYALGLIGKKARHDLNTIREIRNALAHTSTELNFETPEVATLCKGLHSLKAYPHGEIPTHAQRMFAAVVQILLIHCVAKFPGGEKLEIPPTIRDIG
jgi:Mannitol repressor